MTYVFNFCCSLCIWFFSSGVLVMYIGSSLLICIIVIFKSFFSPSCVLLSFFLSPTPLSVRIISSMFPSQVEHLWKFWFCYFYAFVGLYMFLSCGHFWVFLVSSIFFPRVFTNVSIYFNSLWSTWQQVASVLWARVFLELVNGTDCMLLPL